MKKDGVDGCSFEVMAGLRHQVCDSHAFQLQSSEQLYFARLQLSSSKWKSMAHASHPCPALQSYDPPPPPPPELPPLLRRCCARCTACLVNMVDRSSVATLARPLQRAEGKGKVVPVTARGS